MNLFSKIGLPDLVTFNKDLTDFLGPLAPLVVTLFNGLAFLLIMLLVARLSVIAIRAILEFNKEGSSMEGGSHSGLLIASIRSGVEAFLIALVGFLVISAGPNLLYFLAQSTAKTLTVQQTDYLPQFAGPFAGLVAAAQTAVSLGVIVLAIWFGAKIWWSALSAAGLAKASGAGQTPGSMGALNDAAKKTAILAVMAIAAFLTVRFGPQLFFQIIHGSSSLINTQLVP